MEELEIVLECETKKEKEIELISEGTIIYPEATEDLEVTPSAENQEFVGLYGSVRVIGDSDLVPENIKSGVDIFGVVGTVEVPDFEINNCEYLFYNGAREENVNEIIKLCNNITGATRMFDSCENITDIDLSHIKASPEFKNLTMAFRNCTNLKTLKFGDFRDAKPTNLQNMFNGSSSLESVDLTSFDLSETTTVTGLFNGCSSLKEVDLTGVNISNATTGHQMFFNCSSLEKIDLSSVGFNKITSFNQMFSGCSKVTDMDISGIDASPTTYMSSFFTNCGSLTNLRFMNNLGKSYTTKTNNYGQYRIDLSSSTNLTKESLLDVINKLYDLKLTHNVANGGTLYTQQLIIGASNMIKLSSSEIAIATNKGWVVS